MIVKFFGNDYTIPDDILTYIDLVDFTNEIKSSLNSSFNRQIARDVSILENDYFMVKEINDQVSKFIAKLLENNIYDKTVNDYLRKSKGYDLFLSTKKKIIKQIIAIRQEKLDVYKSGVQDAIYKKEASITGLDFGIISGSFVNHMIYSYMDASKQTEQEKEALKVYNREIAELDKVAKSYDKQENYYITNNAIPAMNTVFTYFSFELLDNYVSDLIRVGKFEKAALAHIDLERSNDLLKNLDLANNKHAVIESAFSACPFNIAIYISAIKYELLDYESFQTAKVFKQDESILSSLKRELIDPNDSNKIYFDLKTIKLLALYTNSSLREVSAYSADFIVKSYSDAIELLTNKDKCRMHFNKVSDSDIIKDDSLSKEKSNHIIDAIGSSNLWNKLTNDCGHNDLQDRILALLPDKLILTSRDEINAYLKKRLYESFEAVRREFATEIKEKEAAQLAYERAPKTRIIKLWKDHKIAVIIACVSVIVIIRLIVGPKTVDSGDGWSHQVHNFNKLCEYCEMDDKEVKATHRIHNIFVQDQYYCDECWEISGEDFFERLKEKD